MTSAYESTTILRSVSRRPSCLNAYKSSLKPGYLQFRSYVSQRLQHCSIKFSTLLFHGTTFSDPPTPANCMSQHTTGYPYSAGLQDSALQKWGDSRHSSAVKIFRPLHGTNKWYTHKLAISWRQASIGLRTFPSTRNFAPFSAALSTPRGLQLNLYFRGTSAAQSGAGRPPQNEVKDTIPLPSRRSESKSAKAEQWSMPGSRPISFRIRTSASIALQRRW